MQAGTGKNELFKHAKQENSKQCKTTKYLDWANSKKKKLNNAIAEKKKQKKKQKIGQKNILVETSVFSAQKPAHCLMLST